MGALGFNCLRSGARLAGRAGEAAAAGGPDLHQRARPQRHELNLQRERGSSAAGADLAGLAFYEVDLVARVTFVDDRFRQICGLPPEREEGLQALEFWLEHLHPADREADPGAAPPTPCGELETLSTEYRFLNPARGERWIHHMARVARRDAADARSSTFGVLRDITRDAKSPKTNDAISPGA